MARHVTGHPIPLVVAGRREGDPPKLVADAMLARKELQWRPVHTDLEKIVRDAWSWELRHRSEEHTSELQSLMRISYAVFCSNNKINNKQTNTNKKKQLNKQTTPYLKRH